MANVAKYWLLRRKRSYTYCNKGDILYCRRPRGSQKRGACSSAEIATFATIRHWSEGVTTFTRCWCQFPILH